MVNLWHNIGQFDQVYVLIGWMSICRCVNKCDYSGTYAMTWHCTVEYM